LLGQRDLSFFRVDLEGGGIGVRGVWRQVGLFSRNTSYSFRKGAIVDQRRKRGTESAKELAGHSADGNTIRVYDEDNVADADIANIRHGSEATSQESMRKMFSQATTKRVVLNEDNMANMVGAILDQGALMIKEANARAKSETQILGLNDALTAALSDANQLIIARGVDPDLMTSSLDILDQLNSSVATGDAECGAAVTKIDGIKSMKRDLLRVLRHAARVAIKKEWAVEAEKAQRLASGTNRVGSRGQITQQERNIIPESASTNPFDSTVDQIRRWDAQAEQDDDDEPDYEEPANDQDGPLDVSLPPVKVVHLGPQHPAACNLPKSSSVRPRRRTRASSVSYAWKTHPSPSTRKSSCIISLNWTST
jgi:hypothetical protein